jgi:phage FluMu protein Com
MSISRIAVQKFGLEVQCPQCPELSAYISDGHRADTYVEKIHNRSDYRLLYRD